MINMDEFWEQQKAWTNKQLESLAQAKQDRLNRANAYYNRALYLLGYSNYVLDLSLDNELQYLNFTTQNENSYCAISCRCLGDGEILYGDAPYDCRDILEAIKSVEHVQNEDYTNSLVYALKGKGFYSIRHTFHIDDSLCELRITAKKMEQGYELNIKRHITEPQYFLDAEGTLSIDIDNMDGTQFESFCAQLLSNRGYENVSVTKGSGDQGIDIIAYKDGIKYGIQCKCYSSAVGNKAVQEVFAGKSFYQCHVGIVVTNNYFSTSAIELARQNGVVLWNRDKLMQMISESK